jgi:hypothetical protein
MRRKSDLRHVAAKRLKDGSLAYYWAPPPRARALPGCPNTKPLGSNLLEAMEKAAALNAEFDRRKPYGWSPGGAAIAQVRTELRIPNGFLSSIAKNEM